MSTRVPPDGTVGNQLVRVALTLSAVWLAVLGAALLFAPDEVREVIMPSATGGAALLQVLGAALLGFGAMNWTARGSALGGIYGRAVVMANQTHLTIGALVLVKHGIDAGGQSAAYWAIAGLYALGAVLFIYLAFFSTGLRRR